MPGNDDTQDDVRVDLTLQSANDAFELHQPREFALYGDDQS